MQTTSLQVPAARRLPVHCVLYVPHDERQGPGTVHTLSMDRCHLESRVEVCPGMIVSLYLIFPNAPQDIAIETAIVTWALPGEFGVQIQHLQPAEAHHLREYLSAQVDELHRQGIRIDPDASHTHVSDGPLMCGTSSGE